MFNTGVDKNAIEAAPLNLTSSQQQKERGQRTPRPAHTNTSVGYPSGRSKQMFEEDERHAVDMRKAVLGLQVDGADDSCDSQQNTTAEKGEETTYADSTLSSTQEENNASTTEVNKQADQTLSEYLEIYGQHCIQNTPTQPSTPSSGMLLSQDTTGSTVEGSEPYHLQPEEYNEYQPEGYANITTSVSGVGEQQSEAIQLLKELQKEAQEAISSCNQLLRSFEGSHLNMSTVSAVTTGSMNTTTDLGSHREAEVISAVRTSSTVTLHVDDDNYDNFRRGINSSFSPQHSAFSDPPTQLCTEENDRAVKQEPQLSTESKRPERTSLLSREHNSSIERRSDKKKKCEVQKSKAQSALLSAGASRPQDQLQTSQIKGGKRKGPAASGDHTSVERSHKKNESAVLKSGQQSTLLSAGRQVEHPRR